MLKKRLKAKKVSDKTDYLKLFEATNRYVDDEVVRTNRTRVQVIRELAEEARIARVSSKQMSIGLLKPVRTAQKEIVEEILNENVSAPLDSLLTELQNIQQQLSEANQRLTAAAMEAERQKKNLHRIFYIVSLLWNLLYNFAKFGSRDVLHGQELVASGVNNRSGAAEAQISTDQQQQLVDGWAAFDPASVAQMTLAREVNQRMTEYQQQQRQS
jgi:hypothetical protein